MKKWYTTRFRVCVSGAAAADLPMTGSPLMIKNDGPLGSARQVLIFAKTHSHPVKFCVRSLIYSRRFRAVTGMCQVIL